MNVDGVFSFSAFILAKTRSASFFDNNRFINYSHYEFGKMFFIYHIVIFLAQIHKNVTEQLTNNTVSVQIFLALWIVRNQNACNSCVYYKTQQSAVYLLIV